MRIGWQILRLAPVKRKLSSRQVFALAAAI